MKRTVITMLLIALAGAVFMIGITTVGIVEALATGPINETYPAVIFFVIAALPSYLAVRHCVNEIRKEMEEISKES